MNRVKIEAESCHLILVLALVAVTTLGAYLDTSAVETVGITAFAFLVGFFMKMDTTMTAAVTVLAAIATAVLCAVWCIVQVFLA